MIERFDYIPRYETKDKLGDAPYVVSEDIKILLQGWAERKGFTLPDDEFFTTLREDFKSYLKQIFKNVDLVPEEELSEGIKTLAEASNIFPVSLDSIYFQTAPTLEITRLVDESKKDKGYGRRKSSPSLLQQFKAIKEQGIKEVVLVDDVIYSGSLLTRVTKTLGATNIRVPTVIAGIGVQEGVERLQASGQKVRCVRSYDKVIDEVCERDFYPGIPLGGRSATLTFGERPDNDFSYPYILPFGKPGEWATIPSEWQKPLSWFCVEQTIKLFEEVQRKSGKGVFYSDIERRSFLRYRRPYEVEDILFLELLDPDRRIGL